MDEITIGDKIYISSKLAAKITGYAKDYVGQLCREGRVEARLVGRNWYVLEQSIREHRFGKPEEASQKSSVIAPVAGATWAAPTYKAEVPRLVPELTPKNEGVGQTPAIAEMQSAWREWFESRPNGTTVSVQHYQEQVVEVFDAPEQAESIEPTISSVDTGSFEEVIEEVHEPVQPEEEVEVPVARIHKPEPATAPRPAVPVDMMPIRRPQHSFTGVSEMSHHHASASARSASLAADLAVSEKGSFGTFRVLILVAAAACALVALIGTGYADRFFGGTSIDFGFQKPIIEYLQGSRVYENSL